MIGDLDRFKDLSGLLGTVKQYARVEIQEGKKEYKWNPAPVPFHTDNPKTGIIGFMCLRQDSEYGANLLMDARVVLAKLTDSEQALLASVEMTMPNSGEQYPILIRGHRLQIFYLPFFWTRKVAELDGPTGRALMRFHDLVLEEQAAGRYLSVLPRVGEALFVDNRVMLHARGGLPPTSDRLLVRVLIDDTAQFG